MLLSLYRVFHKTISLLFLFISQLPVDAKGKIMLFWRSNFNKDFKNVPIFIYHPIFDDNICKNINELEYRIQQIYTKKTFLAQ